MSEIKIMQGEPPPKGTSELPPIPLEDMEVGQFVEVPLSSVKAYNTLRARVTRLQHKFPNRRHTIRTQKKDGELTGMTIYRIQDEVDEVHE